MCPGVIKAEDEQKGRMKETKQGSNQELFFGQSYVKIQEADKITGSP